jgi:type I restriction enzyme, S subunit
VTTEAFFKKFDQFAGAPNAIQKMRELILELALQGKLVEQMPSEGHASEIFKREPESRRHPSNIGGEQRYEIPSTWIWVRFDVTGEQRLGKMLDQKGNRGDLQPYLRNTNVQWMRFDLDDIKTMRFEKSETDEFLLRNGDLLICEGGEPGRCAIWKDQKPIMYFQKAIHRIRPRNGILAEYLSFNLRIDAQNGVLDHYFTGATIKHLTGRALAEYSIPLPPLAEQKRIVAKVDELMALCDRLEAQEAERQAKGQRLARAALAQFAKKSTAANLGLVFHKAYDVEPGEIRKAILELAIRGKLSESNTNDIELHSSFHDSESDSNKHRGKLHLFDDGFHGEKTESLFPIPQTWIWTTLGIAVDVRDGTHDTPKYTDVGFPLITSKNISSGKLSFDNIKLISEDDHHQISARSRVVRGDILFAMIGSIGNPVIVNTDQEFSIKNVALFRTRSCKYLEPCFLLLYLKCIADDMKEKAAGAVQSFVSLNFLRTYPFPLPPLSEQKRIVAKVDELMAIVDKLEAQKGRERELAGRLMEAAVREMTA